MPKPWPVKYWLVQAENLGLYRDAPHPDNHNGGRYGTLDAARNAANESAAALGGTWLVLEAMLALQPVADPPAVIEKVLG